MDEQNLSQWFDLAEQKPWEVGVYEVKRPFGTRYCYWDGAFHWSAHSPDDSYRSYKSGRRNGYGREVTHWRGLSTNPDVKKKENKRKTMYVVMKAISNSPVASFSNVNAARDYAGRVNFPVRIRRIRFRTTE